MSDRSRNMTLVLAILILATGVRFFLMQTEQTIATDSFQYLTLGKNLSQGNGFVSDGSHYPDVIRPPIYPLLVAGFFRIVNNLEVAGRLVSLFLGSLTIVPVFVLSRRLFGRQAALISAFLAAFHPRLTETSVSVLTDAPFLFVLMTTLVLGWAALEKGRGSSYLLVGICFGVSFLTRQVGVLFFVSYFALALLFEFGRRGMSRHLGLNLGGLGLGFLIVFLPYLVFVHSLVGRWMEPSFAFSKAMATSGEVARQKAESGDLPGEALPEGVRMTEATHHGLTFDGTELCQWQETIRPQNPESSTPNSGLSTLRKSVQSAHRLVSYGLPTLLTPLLLLFAIYALLGKEWTRESLRKHSFLATMFVVSPAFVVLAGHLESRWLAPAAAIACVWAGHGLGGLATFVRKSAAQILPRKISAVIRERTLVLSFLLFFMIGTAPQIYATHFANTAAPVPEKEVGAWLRANRPDGIIMARKPHTAFYAEARYVSLPFASFAEIKHFAQLKNANILIADEKFIEDLAPHLAFLLEEDASPLGLTRLQAWNSIEGRRIVAYEFDPASP